MGIRSPWLVPCVASSMSYPGLRGGRKGLPPDAGRVIDCGHGRTGDRRVGVPRPGGGGRGTGPGRRGHGVQPRPVRVAAVGGYAGGGRPHAPGRRGPARGAALRPGRRHLRVRPGRRPDERGTAGPQLRPVRLRLLDQRVSGVAGGAGLPRRWRARRRSRRGGGPGRSGPGAVLRLAQGRVRAGGRPGLRRRADDDPARWLHRRAARLRGRAVAVVDRPGRPRWRRARPRRGRRADRADRRARPRPVRPRRRGRDVRGAGTGRARHLGRPARRLRDRDRHSGHLHLRGRRVAERAGRPVLDGAAAVDPGGRGAERVAASPGGGRGGRADVASAGRDGRRHLGLAAVGAGRLAPDRTHSRPRPGTGGRTTGGLARTVIEPEVLVWLDGCLARHGLTRTGPVTLFRERVWASVWNAPTSGGTVWLKGRGAGSAFEPALYEILTEAVPERVLHPLGVDTEFGWLLLPDAGAPIGERLTGPELSTAMQRAVAEYARLQQRLAGAVERMLGVGVADMRPEILPARFDEALAAVETYVHRRATPRERAGYDRLRQMRATFARWCAELAGGGRPASLDHNDLHRGNVLGAGPPDRLEARFYDWGDSVIAHPFACLLFALDTALAADRLALRAAYLEAWGDPGDLLPEADLAVRVAQVARALVWVRTLQDAGPDHEHAGEPLAHLLRLTGANGTHRDAQGRTGSGENRSVDSAGCV